MPWSTIESQRTEKDPIVRYLRLGDHNLSWQDIPTLRQLESDIIRRRSYAPRKQHFYTGWLAYETAVVAERHSKVRETMDGLSRARLSWSMLTHSHGSRMSPEKIKAEHAFALANLRQDIAIERFMRPPAPVAFPATTRDILAKLAVQAYMESDGDERTDDYRGLGTELLFASLVLESATEDDSARIPFASPPRQESPSNYVKNGLGVCNKNAAFDSEVQVYGQHWRPGAAYHVQLKTSYTDSSDRQYDKSKVTMIYADAHMHVETADDGIALARAITSTERTSQHINLITNALQNINDELEAGPIYQY